MEYDILNEIMTGTVATLFTDMGKHANYMKTSSEKGHDKSEIPKSSTTNDLNFYMIGSPESISSFQ